MANVKRVATGITAYGIEEGEHRNNTNTLVDILNATWQNWVPSVAYVGTTLPLASRVCKYTQIGSRVFFDIMQTGGVNTGVSVTDIQFSLPLTPLTGSNRQIACDGITQILGTYANPMALIDLATPSTGVHCANMGTLGTGAYQIYIAGCYEVP